MVTVPKTAMIFVNQRFITQYSLDVAPHRQSRLAGPFFADRELIKSKYERYSF
jgi:hypothetical protein